MLLVSSGADIYGPRDLGRGKTPIELCPPSFAAHLRAIYEERLEKVSTFKRARPAVVGDDDEGDEEVEAPEEAGPCVEEEEEEIRGGSHMKWELVEARSGVGHPWLTHL